MRYCRKTVPVLALMRIPPSLKQYLVDGRYLEPLAELSGMFNSETERELGL